MSGVPTPAVNGTASDAPTMTLHSFADLGTALEVERTPDQHTAVHVDQGLRAIEPDSISADDHSTPIAALAAMSQALDQIARDDAAARARAEVDVVHLNELV